MVPEQEPKYDVNAEGRIVNRATGLAIPDDEPVMIFRARDFHAVDVIEFYADLCKDEAHRQIVLSRADDFSNFKAKHPERMKEPDSPA